MSVEMDERKFLTSRLDNSSNRFIMYHSLLKFYGQNARQYNKYRKAEEKSRNHSTNMHNKAVTWKQVYFEYTKR